MVSTHTAELTIVRDGHGERIVVNRADDVIWISDELLRTTRPDRPRIPGDLEIDGDLISFGTEGEGLGRLTYRVVGRHEQASVHVAKREDTP